MTVNSLAQSNIIRSYSKKEIIQKSKAKRLLAIGLIFSILLAIFLYIFQVNGIAASGYRIGELKKQVYQLEETNKVLQVNISNLKSIDSLQLKTKNFDMVRAQSIEYVVLSPTRAVAAK